MGPLRREGRRQATLRRGGVVGGLLLDRTELLEWPKYSTTCSDRVIYGHVPQGGVAFAVDLLFGACPVIVQYAFSFGGLS